MNALIRTPPLWIAHLAGERAESVRREADMDDRRILAGPPDLARRVAEVKAGNPYPIHAEMCRAVEREYMFAVEQEIHRLLAPYHHDGEWFTATQDQVRSATAKALRAALKLAGRDVRVLGICIKAGFRGQRVYIDPNKEQAFGIVMHQR